MTIQRLLIVEDETKLIGHLQQTLEAEGFSVFTCGSYRELEHLLSLSSKRFDALVLDRLLHGKDSAALIGRIKQGMPEVKVLVLSAINSPSEKASVLNLGADDYLAKPFAGEELTARLRALLRRQSSELKLGNLVLNTFSRILRSGEGEFLLTNKEFLLMRTLLQTPGKIFSKTDLYEQVWQMSPDVESNSVEATVNKLRRKLEEAGANVKIKNSRHSGYWVEE